MKDKTNSRANDPYKLIKTMRALYQESKRKSFEEEKRMWENIEKICKTHSISTDIIILEEFAFKEMSIPVLDYYISKAGQVKENI